MTLIELIEKGLQYDSSWAIYAWRNSPDSPARVGQTQFENGGVLDGMDLIIDGVQLGDALERYCDDDEDSGEHIIWGDFLEWMKDEGYIQE